MSELILFLKTCIASKTLIASVCGLLIIPVAAWLAVRLLAPFIRRMDNDVSWQAPLAATASATPGAIFFLLAVIDLAGASSSGCLAFLWGRILFAGVFALASLSLVRATVIARMRYKQVHELIRHSNYPDDRTLSVARRVGLEVRVIPASEPFCALARPLRPLVLLSRGTLERLNTTELEAALLHERAHALRGDLLLAAIVSFFADLLPLSTRDLLQTYTAAREFAADKHAVRNIDAHQLASAILSLAGTRKMAHAVAGLAEDTTTLKPRIVSLLEERAEQTGLFGRRMIAGGVLIAIAIFSLTPAVLSGLNYYVCSIKGMSV